MILMFFFLITSFVFYYLSSFNTLKKEHRYVFIVLFIISAIFLRFLVNPEDNKDYYGYYSFNNFSEPKDFLSYFLTEPYLYIVYSFFSFFFENKDLVFLLIYWFNFFVCISFFVWLLNRPDIDMWKKNLLFVFYFFLFGFTLLRNGPAYILFACYFYYSYRKIKYKKVLLAPFMHISSLVVLIVMFYRSKYFIRFFLFGIVFVFLVLIIFLPLLTNIIALQKSLSKVDAYSEKMDVVSIFHKIYFVFISAIMIVTILVYKKKAFHPFIITTLAFYFISYFINPVVGFRFTPYIIFSILLYKHEGEYNKSLVRFLNVVSILLLPYYIFTLFDTHVL